MMILASLPSLPGVDVHAVAAFLQHAAGNGLLALYDRLANHGVSGGSWFALGIMPYVSARIFLRIGEAAGLRARSRWWGRGLTLGLSAVQSVGFARWLERVPGAVTGGGGAGFVVQTAVLVTTGAMVLGWMAEQATMAGEGDAPDLAPDATAVPTLRELPRSVAEPVPLRVATPVPVPVDRPVT